MNDTIIDIMANNHRRSSKVTGARYILYIGLLLGSVFAAYTATTNTAHASPVVGFNPGIIIDDFVFTNSKSMDTTQIQAFLNSKVSSCDTNGTQPASDFGRPDLTHAQYAASQGWSAPPYTCLKDYSENGVSAAQLIYNTSQQYKINPQVLIVLLQKEEGLVTDTWPLATQYKTATGYGCPDTTVCDSQYFGLTNQLHWSGTMFRAIIDKNPNWYTPYILGNNYIKWHPDHWNATTSTWQDICGGTTVNIQNAATQALYNYTPYQPNAASLAAGYGLGDSCSSYGNRNFYLYFTDWFGSTKEMYRYSFESLIGTAGSVIPVSVNTDTIQSLTVGDSMYVFYNNKNTGTLEYALYKNSTWSRYILDGPSSSAPGSIQTPINVSSITAFSYFGQPQLFYTDAATKTVRHGFISNGLFHIETLDGTATSVIKSSRQLGSAISGFDFNNGQIQLYYYDTVSNSLVHTWWNGQIWGSETLDGTATSVIKSSRQLGSAISGFDFNNGQIQLYYYDTVNGVLIHTWFSTTWNTEILDGTATSLFGNVINSGKHIDAQLLNESAFVMYYDDATGFTGGRTSAWRIGYTNGSWVPNILDGGSISSKTGSTASVPLSNPSITQYNGSIQIFYADSNNNLKHTWLNKQ